MISGDTNYSPALVALAKGADVLVHEVIYLPGIDRLLARIPDAVTLRKHLVDSHTTPEDVGRVAGPGSSQDTGAVTLRSGRRSHHHRRDVGRGVRKHYQGPIVVGRA